MYGRHKRLPEEPATKKKHNKKHIKQFCNFLTYLPIARSRYTKNCTQFKMLLRGGRRVEMKWWRFMYFGKETPCFMCF